MSLPSRRAGLSYGDKPKPLLSMVGGKSTKADDKASNNSKSSSTESENASPGTKASTGGAGAKTGLGVNKPMFKMPASLSGDDSDDEKSNVNGKPGKNKAVSLAGLGRKSPSKNADVKTGPPKFKVPDSLSSDDVDSDGNNKPIPNKAPPTGLARKISGPCGASADMIARKATFNLNMPRSCSSDDLASDKLAKGDKALEDKTSSAGATSQPGRKTSLSRFNVPGTSSPDEIAGGSPDEPSTKPTSQAASAPVSYPNPRRMKKITFSSDEESDRGARANSNLRKTTFGASKTGKHANSLGRDDPEDEGPLKRRKVETKSATLPGSSQNKSSQESARAPTSSGEHMLDSLGFARKNKVKATFGSKGAPIRSEPRQERTGLAAGWGVRRPPPKEPTPSSSSTSSVSVPEEVWQERKKQKAKERKAERKAERKSKSFKAPSASPEAAKNKPIFRTPAAELSDSSTGTILAKRKTFKGKKGKGTKAVDSDEDKPARPVFKTYSSDEDDINARPSEPRMDLSDLSDHKDEDEDEAAADAPVCPWCGEPVDGALLESYKQGRSRLTVREQTRFCQRHKAQKAADLWTARGYPTIDWEGLEERMAGYYDSLKGVVEGIAPSSYRDALAAKIASGADRALKKEGNLNPGYYGPRGFNFMCDKLVVYFGDMLKKHAVHDRVISGRGSAAFIQNVLVAEMGVRLIGEDMGVSLERAREILEESKGIGEMVHEDM